MLFRFLFVSTLLCKAIDGEGTEKKTKPLSLPIPLELPTRNPGADQCWLRVEDVELTETVAIYCHIAQAFLAYHIHDYNIRKMTEDGVDVSLWIEKPRVGSVSAYGPPAAVNGIKHWRATTIMDPTTKRRLYVSKNADCKLIMYSREGITNYSVDCETVLYFVNESMRASAVVTRANYPILVLSLFLVWVSWNA